MSKETREFVKSFESWWFFFHPLARDLKECGTREATRNRRRRIRNTLDLLMFLAERNDLSCVSIQDRAIVSFLLLPHSSFVESSFPSFLLAMETDHVDRIPTSEDELFALLCLSGSGSLIPPTRSEFNDHKAVYFTL